MTQLLGIREIIKIFVGRYENYLKPIGKFILTFITLMMIRSNVGYASRLGNVAIILIVSLLASFMPLNFIPVIAALVVLLDMYSMSMICAAFIGILLFVMFLVYFRFAPKDTILLMLTPILFVMKIPYVIPLVAGLVAAPTAIVSVGCGVIIYYALYILDINSDFLMGHGMQDALTDLKLIMDLFISNKEMLVFVLAFSVTIIAVNIIRRLDVDHSWTIAIVTGSLLDIVMVLAGDLKMNAYVHPAGLILGSILGVITVVIIKFFAFNVDYSKTEKVSFEDDEYVYFVKAVPKVNYQQPQAKKKKKNVRPSEERVEGKIRRRETLREEIPEEEYEEPDVKAVDERPQVEEMYDEEFVMSEIDDSSDIDEIIDDSEALPIYEPKRQRMTGIERAAAAKARKDREEKK